MMELFSEADIKPRKYEPTGENDANTCQTEVTLVLIVTAVVLYTNNRILDNGKWAVLFSGE